MKGMIQQLYDKRCEKQRELEKKASSGYDVLEKMAGAVATIEKCATGWGEIAAKAVGLAAPAAVGAIGGAAIGGIADAIRPKAKDERERKKRLVKSLLTGAAFGGLAGAGVSAYSYQSGAHDKGHPLAFFDPTIPDAVGYGLTGFGTARTGLVGQLRGFRKYGPQYIATDAVGADALKDAIATFRNAGGVRTADEATRLKFIEDVFNNPSVAKSHGGLNSTGHSIHLENIVNAEKARLGVSSLTPAQRLAAYEAKLGPTKKILSRSRYAARYPAHSWSSHAPKKLTALAALIGGLTLVGNKYTELFGDRD